MKSLYHSISSFVFLLLALVMVSFPAHANTIVGVESCMTCMTCITAEMPPGAVNALEGTKKYIKVASTIDSNSNALGSSSTNLIMPVIGGGDPTDVITVDIGKINQRTYFAFHQNLILANHWRL